MVTSSKEAEIRSATRERNRLEPSKLQPIHEAVRGILVLMQVVELFTGWTRIRAMCIATNDLYPVPSYFFDTEIRETADTPFAKLIS